MDSRRASYYTFKSIKRGCWPQGLETLSQEGGSENDCATQQLDVSTVQPQYVRFTPSTIALMLQVQAKSEELHRTVSLPCARLSVLRHFLRWHDASSSQQISAYYKEGFNQLEAAMQKLADNAAK